MKKNSIIFLVILTLCACMTGDKQQIVTVKNKYTLAIPDFLQKASNLNEEASLQYQHPLKEFYVIVIDESKAEMQRALVENHLTEAYSNDIKGYTDLLLTGMEEKITQLHKSKIRVTKINNLPARLLTMRGKIEGIDAFYSLAFIEGKERYYQIMAWTAASKEKEFKDQMTRIMYSFKEL